MGEAYNGIILDVSDVIADGIVESLVCPEDLATFRSDPHLVLPVVSDEPHPVPCDASPLSDEDLPDQAIHRPIFPVALREVPCPAAFAVVFVVVVLLQVLRLGGFDPGDEIIEDVQVPIDGVRVYLGDAEAKKKIAKLKKKMK